ncbi:hypothetical protein EDC96DRAFT_538659 [Choanephora cucurbitarum]|nr:hypothetical protein EDC96DRAFT_538659 [Choanephora cucurbitarum]
MYSSLAIYLLFLLQYRFLCRLSTLLMSCSTAPCASSGLEASRKKNKSCPSQEQKNPAGFQSKIDSSGESVKR